MVGAALLVTVEAATVGLLTSGCACWLAVTILAHPLGLAGGAVLEVAAAEEAVELVAATAAGTELGWVVAADSAAPVLEVESVRPEAAGDTALAELSDGVASPLAAPDSAGN